MPKPTPGKQYVIQDEDTLSQVARRAYGNASHWPRIWRANQSSLRSGNPDLIYPGEVIYIPEIAELLRDAPDISNREPDELSIVLDGLEIRPTASKVMLTMDTASDGWTATLPWIPGENPELDARLVPFGYTPAKVYIGGKLKITGYLYVSESSISNSGTAKNLEGFSRTADLIDSNLRPPYEENNVTLKQRANKLIQPHGIKAVFEAPAGGPFDRVTASETDKTGAHLKRLAFERALLFSSTPEGNALFHRADTKSPPTVTLEEGQYPVGRLSLRPNGRLRFNSYRAINITPFGANESPAVKDSKVPRSRFRTFKVHDSTKGELGDIATWERNKAIIESLTIPIPVATWINPGTGGPWETNTKVTVVAPSIHVPNGFDFLIKSVEFEEKENEKSAILNIVPPQVYTKEEVTEPWG
jgi:prophage tail gpP-like protein